MLADDVTCGCRQCSSQLPAGHALPGTRRRRSSGKKSRTHAQLAGWLATLITCSATTFAIALLPRCTLNVEVGNAS